MSNVTILTPAANKKLTTLEQIKQELEITNSTDDAFLNDLIDRMSGRIEDFCHRIFAKQTYQEKVAGFGDKILLLTHTPIISVSSVLCDSSPITDYEIYNANAGELYRSIGWAWDATVWWKASSFPSSNNPEQNFTVVYEAGYVLPGDDEAQTLPKTIEDACIQCVKEAYLKRRDDPNVSSEKLGNYSVTYDPTPLLFRLLYNWVRIF